MIASTEIAVYPLRQDRLGPAVKKVCAGSRKCESAANTAIEKRVCALRGKGPVPVAPGFEVG
jgi:hypothetical protein